MINGTKLKKHNKGHQRYKSLPPQKALPVNKKKKGGKDNKISDNVTKKESVCKSPQSTPVSPTKSVSKRGGDSPFATIQKMEHKKNM